VTGREWQPGDVVIWRPQGDSEPEVLFRFLGGDDYDTPEWQSAVGGCAYPLASDLSPLVVIDPTVITGPHETGDTDPVREISRCLKRLAEGDGADAENGPYRGQIAARLSAAFRATIIPPKPPEPTGLGAVVEDAKGFVYVRGYTDDVHTHPWHVIDPSANACMAWWKYDNIAAVKVLSEGVVA
jgi:hypothetical protein